MKATPTKTIIIFIVLTIASVCLVVFGQDAADSTVKNVLSLLGSAMFAAGLTYLLVKMG